MNNNHILRRVRYIFDLNDSKMIKIFAHADLKVTHEQVCAWLKKDDDEGFDEIYDKQLATFLNGFIIEKRGRRDGDQPKAEKSLSNNLIMRKLKIALNLKSHDLIDLLALADLRISEHELSAFFRKPSQKQYRLCKDQFLRNLLMGMQLKYRPKE